MKPKSHIFLTGKNQQGGLFALGLILLALTVSFAQGKTQKRVTGLQLGDAFEGSRVSINADANLADYEAFRRGDRFYVRIPAAEFVSAVPHYRANGFDDVQVQKVGDSVVVSFKLQPGASARVDLRGNRLDVIFSSPYRSSFLASRGASTPASSQNPQPAGTRSQDAAGPLPPGSVSASRDRIVKESTSDGNDGRPAPDPWAINPSGDLGRRNKKTPAANTLATSSPTPLATPATSSNYPSIYSSTATASPSPVTAAARSVGWRERASALRRWAAANRLATLVAALLLLSVILYLVMVYRGRRDKSRQAGVPKVQPKYSQVDELSESSTSSSDARSMNVNKNEPAAHVPNVTSDKAARPSAAASKPTRPASVPAVPSADGANWAKPAVVAPVEYSNEEEEREVFEL
jgi:hypothetical protein